MVKARRPCRVEGCLLPKAAPSHSCAYHGLLRQPIEFQVAASRARLAAVPEEDRRSRVPDHLWPPGHRFCAACQSFAPLFYFPPNGSQCRACSSAVQHARMIEKTYDLTAAEYDALLLLQDGRCAICRQKPVSQRLAVDHNHATGEVRGLLCSRDNHDLLGAGHDNADRLRAAVNYLDTPPMSGRWAPVDIRPAAKRRATDRASIDPTYLMFDHEGSSRPLPTILENVAKRMTVDQLLFAGGRSDPATGTYWLQYRPAGAESPPWETAEALPEVDTYGRASDTESAVVTPMVTAGHGV